MSFILVVDPHTLPTNIYYDIRVIRLSEPCFVLHLVHLYTQNLRAYALVWERARAPVSKERRKKIYKASISTRMDATSPHLCLITKTSCHSACWFRLYYRPPVCRIITHNLLVLFFPAHMTIAQINRAVVLLKLNTSRVLHGPSQFANLRGTDLYFFNLEMKWQITPLVTG